MNPIILEYIKKSNEQSIEKIIDNNKKKLLVINDTITNTIVETNPNNSNNNFYPILFGLLFISISRGLYFFTYKK